jgi:trk system potassium uptake protein TrkA
MIVGCGRVGSTLAKLLLAEGHEVVVIDENPASFKRLGTHFSGNVEVGTGIDYDVLKRAGAAEADGFVAVTDGDNRNIMAALLAQRMFNIRKIVARIYDPPRGQLYRELGIETVCPTTVGAKLIRDRLLDAPGETPASFDLGGLSPVTAAIDAADAGKTVQELELDGKIRVVAIRRGKTVLIPTSREVIAPGDEVSAVVAPDALGLFGSRLKSRPGLQASA